MNIRNTIRQVRRVITGFVEEQAAFLEQSHVELRGVTQQVRQSSERFERWIRSTVFNTNLAGTQSVSQPFAARACLDSYGSFVAIRFQCITSKSGSEERVGDSSRLYIDFYVTFFGGLSVGR